MLHNFHIQGIGLVFLGAVWKLFGCRHRQIGLRSILMELFWVVQFVLIVGLFLGIVEGLGRLPHFPFRHSLDQVCINNIVISHILRKGSIVCS